jgi:adenylate kinase family enzyme
MSRLSSHIYEDPLPDAEEKKIRLDPIVLSLLERVRLKARCRMAWLHHLWMEAGLQNKPQNSAKDAVESILEHKDTAEAQIAWEHESLSMRPLFERLDEIEHVIAADKTSRWTQLSTTFGIADKESDLLQTCLALRLDPDLARLFAHLQDNISRNYVTEHLVQRLFAHGHDSIWHGESPLRLWRLVIEQEMPPPDPPAYRIDPLIADYLLGVGTLDPALVGKAAVHRPLPPLVNWPVQSGRQFIERQLNAGSGKGARLIISGVPGSGRRTLAAVISADLGMPLLTMDSDAIEKEFWTEIYRHAQRQAFLDRNGLCWCGETVGQVEWPRQIVPFPVQFAILEPGQALPVHESFVDHCVDMPALTLDERKALWLKYIPAAATWPADDFNRLVHQYQVTVGDIALASQKGTDSAYEAKAGIRETNRYRLGELAQRMAAPFRLEDLVVTESVHEVIEDFLFEASDRSALWECENVRRLFPQGRSLMALLSGPSGTGKTMAAQVIAAELGLDLFRIDLAAVVSKYVGETSRNLERILSRAQNMDIVLLFDEADALLGKRTEIKDAHDRFANTDTNYLLQALESDYQGIALLSTNRKENIDEAFLRRVRYLIEFAKPDAVQRLLLWKQLINEMAGPQALKSNGNKAGTLKQRLEVVANGIELTGAQIKYAVLAALFTARRDRQPLGMKHILRGIDRELMKEGRVLTQRERERLQVHGR